MAKLRKAQELKSEETTEQFSLFNEPPRKKLKKVREFFDAVR